MKKSTQELVSLIQNTDNIELYLKENEAELLYLTSTITFSICWKKSI